MSYTITDISHTLAETSYMRTNIYVVPGVTSWDTDTKTIRIQYPGWNNAATYSTYTLGVCTLYKKTSDQGNRVQSNTVFD